METIEKYSFGLIQISGKEFSNDVIIFPEEVIPNWWRKEGHNLHMEDLQEVIARKPDTLIVGKGYNGIMKVPKSLIQELEDKGITTLAKKSNEAVKEYNKLLKEGKRVAAALHLTC
ncbi:MAG: Mth938-like domain-containing protein [Candidatus Heimdallarchaeota archaeon]|nr:MAG: Mth938-like domain-containing protein [Candidatus Heimdallarchaeota archaeon]